MGKICLDAIARRKTEQESARQKGEETAIAAWHLRVIWDGARLAGPRKPRPWTDLSGASDRDPGSRTQSFEQSEDHLNPHQSMGICAVFLGNDGLILKTPIPTAANAKSLRGSDIRARGEYLT